MLAVLSVYPSESRDVDDAELVLLRAGAADLLGGAATHGHRNASDVRSRAVFEEATGAMFRARASDGIILDANPRLLALLGGARDEIVGAPTATFWSAPLGQGAAVRGSRDRSVFITAVRSLRGDERTCIFSLSSPTDDIVEGWLVTVTERERAEELIARTRRMQALGTLAAGVAHDFNNMLTVVLANLSMARGEPGAEREELLGEAEAAAQRAQSLTRQLLTFALGGGTNQRPLDISTVVRDAAQLSSRGARSRCRLEIPAGLWSVEADAGQIAQVVHNLVLNALEATPGSDPVEVSLANIDFDEGTPARHVRLRVVDHGVGIPPEALQRLFDPFFSTKNRGSGLGLAVVHSIVLRYGGHVAVESDSGTTTFDAFFPASTSRAHAPSTRSPATSAQIGGRVLIMDDDESLRRVAVKALSSAGCEVDTAADGAVALEVLLRARAERRPFTLVILDVTVPGGMGGLETLVRLRTLDDDVPVLISSGYVDDPVMVHPREHGFAGALAKPWTPPDLARAIAAIMAPATGATVAAP